MTLLSKISKIILVIYITLNILDALLLPAIQFISLDNFLIPLVGIIILNSFWKNKTFQITFILVLVKVVTEFLSNYFIGFVWSNFAYSGIWIKYFLFIWSCCYLMTRNLNIKIIDNILIFFTTILIVINCIQLLRIDYISKALESIYVHRQDLIDYNFAGFDGFRLNGTQTNPNDNGIMLLLLMCFFYLRKIKYKEIWAILLVMLILLTQSRTAFISLCFISFLYFLPVMKSISYRKVMIIISSILISFTLLIILGFKTLLLLFNGSAFTSNSFMVRLGNIKEVTYGLDNHQFFGYGKIQSFQLFFGRSIDNELAYELAQYGFLGLLLYLLIIAVMHFLIQKYSGVRRAFMFTGLILLFGVTNLSLLNSEVGILFCMFFILLILARSKPLKYYS